jgi:N-acetylglutamate synthase
MGPTAADLAHIRGIEERAFNAWPALQTVLAGGWVLRFANGYTKRANSVNALTPTCGAIEALQFARPLYEQAGWPVVFRLSPLAPGRADADLAACGFRHADETVVMTAPIDANVAIDADVTISSRPTSEWAAGFAVANAVPHRHAATHDSMLTAIRLPVAFASLQHDGQAIAWGLAVAERGMVGLFDIVTSPAARRTGAARRLVGSLLAWGRTHEARASYLQVVATNAPAIPLYRSFGYDEAYRYHYRIGP